jgi:hypothetical protein
MSAALRLFTIAAGSLLRNDLTEEAKKAGKVAPRDRKTVAKNYSSFHPVCTENLNPNIVVMKPAEDRV